ncbi:MAG: LysM peptidoglycan-binding domain-containing protein [Flavobacteriaceae bacterium]|jgi:LysM repeat protein|nr:LysM peptidoglycan-binding domain-containing protein [Formosa sp.]MDG1375367.1 LysM peptidoglycan-binding domain-containing protein [Flavobacteriaceae bacterium]MDG2498275.1 LysM peptidoglycan-binding domain-containing protein [Flavobacteriaceae bacterium]
MKKFLIILGIIAFNSLCNAQNLKTHNVQVGETVESIAKLYKITPQDIYALNPDARSNFSLNSVLIIPKSFIPKSISSEVVKELISYKVYKVRRKETLFGIAQKFNVTVEEIKAHNKELYSKSLRRGDKIYIPQFKMTTNQISTQVIQKYTVLPKEGKWRIAYKFGISVPDLEALNPAMGPFLKAGQQLNVPNISDTDKKVIEEDDYGYYTVKAKEGFFRLEKKLGLTQEQLELLNPELIDQGLKLGMVLKIPKRSIQNIATETFPIVNLSDSLVDFSPKKMALLLPFKTKSIDFDSLNLAKIQLKRDGFINISTDFYAGVVMAIDSAKRLGISTKLEVFDTNAQPLDLKTVLLQTNFSNFDAVLGPITTQNLELIAKYVEKDSVPVISPFVKTKNIYHNLFQTIPDETWMRTKMINYVKSDTIPHQTLIIYDAKNLATANYLKTEFPEATLLTSKKDDEGLEQFFLMLEDVQAALLSGRTLVFLESNNVGFVSNVTSMLNAMNGITILKDEDDNETEIDRDIFLMTTSKNRAFEGSNISNYDLSNLHFQYPSVNFDSQFSEAFEQRYIQQFGTFPNKYAIRGFDVTMDILLRLSKFGTLYTQTSSFQTAYLENKFQYVLQPYGGYKNEAGYILKYEDLQIVKVQD